MQTSECAMSNPKVIVKKIIHADPERVFEAWTKPELMNQWYVGGKGTASTKVDLRVGGSYTNTMHIEMDEHSCKGCNSEVGATAPKGSIQSFLHEGTYLEITRPTRLVFTWNSPSVQNTVVTVDLRAVELGTEVTITHELQSQEACESHQGGWTYALEGLAKYLG